MSKGGPDVAEQRSYYTERWQKFEYANYPETVRMAAVLNYLVDAKLPEAAKICDLGCGAGWATSILGSFGETTGVDMSDVTAARERYTHCRFESANILEWEAPLGTCDLVVSLEVIEHIETATGQALYLRKASELLKPGGCLILTTPNRKTMDAVPGGGRMCSNQPIENWLTAAELRAMLEMAGFRIQSLNTVLLGVGLLGWYRVVNSTKVNRVLDAIGLGRAWRAAACRLGYGLHLAALARRASSR
jgi:SAM-dependent methyltransferase